MRPNAAGIDIGATEIFVAVPADRDTDSVRSFPTFRQDLHELADWLQHKAAPWKARPVRRVFIPKANGRQRPLGIPVILDAE